MKQPLVIEVKNLIMHYKTAQKKEGFLASLVSVFHKKYKILRAVDDISFSVARGEIRGLIGPNGAGKSTIIKILSGILHPTSGYVNAVGFTPWKDRELYVKNLGVVFGHKTQLLWDIPAIDTYYLYQKIYGIPLHEFNKRLKYFSNLLELEKIIYQPVRVLSLGERMKCEFVCALIHNPPLVFLDEPTIGLDLTSKDAVRFFIKHMNKENNTTFILTTHDLLDVENLCHNVTVINNGRVTYDDKLSTLKHYIDKKCIDIHFSQEVKELSLSQNFNILQQDEYSVKLEVDISKCKIQNAVEELIGKLPINDINISDIPIEDIIKKIYQH